MFWLGHGLAIVFVFVFVGCSGSVAQDQAVRNAPVPSRPVVGSWPNWRGPETRGVARDVRLDAEWPADELPLAWKVPLEAGWSSPVVDQGRVFVTDRAAGEERVLAFDAQTGKGLWEVRTTVDFDPHPVGRRHGNGPTSTCAISDSHVYSLGIAGLLQCLDAATGRVVWRISLPAKFGKSEPLPDGRARLNGTTNVIVPTGPGQGAPVPLFGYTGSPVISGDLLILEVGGERGGTVMAFDKRTGTVRWKALRENVAYSSPVVAQLAGIDQVVAMTGPRVVGLRLDGGALL